MILKYFKGAKNKTKKNMGQRPYVTCKMLTIHSFADFYCLLGAKKVQGWQLIISLKKTGCLVHNVENFRI